MLGVQDAGTPLPWPLPPLLRLHLLGATWDCEGDWLQKYEEVLHGLPGVQRVEITLVGPGLEGAKGVEAGEEREGVQLPPWLVLVQGVLKQRGRSGGRGGKSTRRSVSFL